jgi:hypothetical protein
LGGRGRRISEFEASLVYKVSSRTARAIIEKPCLKKQKQNKKPENLAKAQSTHCTSYNNSGRLQLPTISNGQIMEIETKQIHSETNRSYEPNGSNRYL